MTVNVFRYRDAENSFGLEVDKYKRPSRKICLYLCFILFPLLPFPFPFLRLYFLPFLPPPPKPRPPLLPAANELPLDMLTLTYLF